MTSGVICCCYYPKLPIKTLNLQDHSYLHHFVKSTWPLVLASKCFTTSREFQTAIFDAAKCIMELRLNENVTSDNAAGVYHVEFHMMQVTTSRLSIPANAAVSLDRAANVKRGVKFAASS